MTRILHTSDWHLGASFHGIDRSADEQVALDAIIHQCAEQAVDCVVITGDIFDTANPGADEQRRYYQTLLRLVQEGGVGSVVVIAGNHDSGNRLDGPREVLESCNIIVRGVLPSNATPSSCIVPLAGRTNESVALCVAIPYLRETDLIMPPGDESIATRQARAMQERYEAILIEARQQATLKNLPLVVMAHAFVRGGTLGGAERTVIGEVTVGNLGQVNAACLGEGAAYVALGHLHRPQRINGLDHWRYSGSLLPTGFDEVGTKRSVVIATLDGDKPAAIETFELPVYRRYAAIEGTREEVITAISLLPIATADEPSPLLMATVLISEERHGIANDITTCANSRGWIAIRVLRKNVALANATMRTPTSVTIEDIAPLDVFHYAHRGRHSGNAPSAELEYAFNTLLAEETSGGAR